MQFFVVLLIFATRSCILAVEDHVRKRYAEGDLIFAHVLFRHGDRTPIDPYPNDPHRDSAEWPTEWGQLTNRGKKQHFELGKWLRRRYNELVNSTYSRQEIHIQSTNVDRTLMSAQANLAGFYPPVGKDVWTEELLWQPIPVHTKEEKHDKVLAAKKECPAYDHALSKLRRSDEWVLINRRNKALYAYLTENTGREITNMEGVEYIGNVLFIETLYNKTLPEWTRKVYPEPILSISAQSFATYTYTPELARLKSGPLLKEMLDRFRNKTRGKLKPDRAMWVYSAHDTTVANLLNTLGLFEWHNPPYAACVMVELRQTASGPAVSVLYKNTTADPTPLHIPDCGPLCPLPRMYELYEKVLPLDWDSECRLSSFLMSYAEADEFGSLGGTVTFILIALISVLLLLVVFAGLIIFRRHGLRDSSWYYRIDD